MTTMDSSTSAAVLCTPLVDNPLRSPRVKRMHSGLQQRLTMESSFEQHVSKCNPQAKSPLWNTLPAELRYMVSQSAQTYAGHSGGPRIGAYLQTFARQTLRSSSSPQHSTRTCPALIQSTRTVVDLTTARP
jgi:hypothetical protein